MTTHRLLLTTVTALAVAACASPHWVKPGGSPESFQRDVYECERETRMAGAGFSTGAFRNLEMEDFANRCLKARGWRRER